MSLTLRDAQHLCWKNYRRLGEPTKIDIPGYLLAEAGKIASMTKDLENAGHVDENLCSALASGLSRLLFAAFVLAERSGVELEQAFLQEMNDYVISHIG